MKKLEDYQVQELNLSQQKNINGGGWWIPVIMLVGSMINDAQNNPDDFWAGYNAVTN